MNDVPTKEQQCISELYLLLDSISQKSLHKDKSLFDMFRVSGGIGPYERRPPICKKLDCILLKYEDVIYESLKLSNNK